MKKQKPIVAEAIRKINCKLAPIFKKESQLAPIFPDADHSFCQKQADAGISLTPISPASCLICKNLGYWKDKNGIVRTCLDCLKSGRLNQL